MNPCLDLSLDTLDRAQWKAPGEHQLPVLSTRGIRAVEAHAFAQADSYLLMQAAGRRTAAYLLQDLQLSAHRISHCVVLAGPGNNGGDACLVAGLLHQAGLQVEWVNLQGPEGGSSDRQKAQAWCSSTGLAPSTTPAKLLEAEEPTATSRAKHLLIVDGLLGIGCDRAPTGNILKWIEWCQRQHQGGARVVALDCPSGLDCNTGLTPGAAVRADATTTYIALKTGLLSNQGKDLCGDIRVDSLGCDDLITALLDSSTPAESSADRSLCLSHQNLRATLPRRLHHTHKGSFGSLSVLGGASGMVGAALLAARAAIHMGAGRVAYTLMSEWDHRHPDVLLPGFEAFLDLQYPELMNKGIDESLAFASVVVAGPGMGQSFDSLSALNRLLEAHKPMLWDADALNILANEADLQASLASRPAELGLVITPHPLEAARLLGTTAEDINQNRTRSALELAKRFSCITVLKGAGTVIASSDGSCSINLTGGPMLATGGTGDVLAGTIGAFMAQGLSPLAASRLGVWLHGHACDPLPGEALGPQYCTASGLIQRMQGQLNGQLNAQPLGR